MTGERSAERYDMPRSIQPVSRSLPSSGEARSLRDDTTGEGTDEGKERDMEAGRNL